MTPGERRAYWLGMRRGVQAMHHATSFPVSESVSSYAERRGLLGMLRRSCDELVALADASAERDDLPPGVES